MKKIGLALGGGGVRGVLHALVLELFDELDIKPDIIAGTSIGAIMGALYASGMTGREIQDLIEKHIIKGSDTWDDIVRKKDTLMSWLKGFSFEKGRGGVISADKFINHLLDPIADLEFDQLNIPLKVIATDYNEACEVVFDSGKVLPAVKASMAVPGVFKPVDIDDRLFIDGGVVNQVPYDKVMDDDHFTIAIDVGSGLSLDSVEEPNTVEVTLRMFEIMQEVMMTNKMKQIEPDIYFKPELKDIYFLNFRQIEDVLEQAKSSIGSFKKELQDKLKSSNSTSKTED